MMLIDVDLAREDAEKYAANIGSLLGGVVFDLLEHPMIGVSLFMLKHRESRDSVSYYMGII